MSMTVDGKWLVVVLGQRFAMSVVADEPPDVITAFNTSYRRREGQGVKATYDRLLDEKGALVGLQVWPVPGGSGDIMERLAQSAIPSVPGWSSLFPDLLFRGGRTRR